MIFFAALIEDMARFFLEGTTSFDIDETLEVMKLIDLCLLAEAKPDEWIKM